MELLALCGALRAVRFGLVVLAARTGERLAVGAYGIRTATGTAKTAVAENNTNRHGKHGNSDDG